MPVAANGLPAFAQYKPAGDGRYTPWSIVVEPWLNPAGIPARQVKKLPRRQPKNRLQYQKSRSQTILRSRLVKSRP